MTIDNVPHDVLTTDNVFSHLGEDRDREQVCVHGDPGEDLDLIVHHNLPPDLRPLVPGLLDPVHRRH